jgi:CDP-glucose 4,6-dehydratase
VLWDGDAAWECAQGRHPHETAFIFLDSSRVRSVIGWHPRWTLDVALEQTVVWWKAQLAGADMNAETLRQIKRFETGFPGDV